MLGLQEVPPVLAESFLSSPPTRDRMFLLWALQAGDGRQGGKDGEKHQGREKRDMDWRRRCGSSRGQCEELPRTSRSSRITC